jgi:hypothetical protein
MQMQERERNASCRVHATFSKKDMGAEELRLKNESRWAEAEKRRAQLQVEEDTLPLSGAKTAPVPETRVVREPKQQMFSSLRAAKVRDVKQHFAKIQDAKVRRCVQ